MKELHGEDLASHTASCTVVLRKDGCEALTGACIGGLLSREIMRIYDGGGFSADAVCGRLCARQCAHEMREGPSQSVCGGGLQTTVSGLG